MASYFRETIGQRSYLGLDLDNGVRHYLRWSPVASSRTYGADARLTPPVAPPVGPPLLYPEISEPARMARSFDWPDLVQVRERKGRIYGLFRDGVTRVYVGMSRDRKRSHWRRARVVLCWKLEEPDRPETVRTPTGWHVDHWADRRPEPTREPTPAPQLAPVQVPVPVPAHARLALPLCDRARPLATRRAVQGPVRFVDRSYRQMRPPVVRSGLGSRLRRSA
jgi:hypothetical protein